MYFKCLFFLLIQPLNTVATVYDITDSSVSEECIRKSAQIKTVSKTECILRCNRINSIAILESEICYCAAKDCTKVPSKTSQIFTRVAIHGSSVIPEEKSYNIKESQLIETLPEIKKTWKLSFDFNIKTISTKWTYLLQIMPETYNDCNGAIRLPAIMFPAGSSQLHISYVNSIDYGYYSKEELPLNKFTNVKVSQLKGFISILTNKTAYTYTISINGKIVFSETGYNAQEIYNVRIYASRCDPADAVVKNIQFQNVV